MSTDFPDPPVPDETENETFRTLWRHFPGVAVAYRAVAGELSAIGSLDSRAVGLVNFAIAVGTGGRSAVRTAGLQALAEGLVPNELREVAVCASTTIGLPGTIQALEIIDELLQR